MEANAGTIATTFRSNGRAVVRIICMLCGLVCLGCIGPGNSQTKAEKLQLDLAQNQAELDTLREELLEARLWQIRQQKTVDDYAAILLRQGFENYKDNPEWQKRRSRAESYDSICRQLQSEINNLEDVVIPEIKVALQVVEESN
ncbi:MAG: hypothetical protein MK108_16510 [Mariniblastus sp.]|nr:hypothetical protein [Mariniblastus sp.]